MFSRLFLIIVVVISARSFSQTSRLDYFVYTKNTVDTTSIKTYLMFNQLESLFVWKSENSNGNREVKTDNDDLKVKLVYNDTVGLRVLNKYENNDIKINESFWGNNYMISEPKGIIWDLQNEKKKIGSLTCQKAITRFRGRDYIAWFTIDIPIPAGPWKLFGLPGAILEFQDESGKIYSSAIKVTINESTDIEEIIESNKGEGKAINIKEYVKLKQNENELMLKYAMTKLGREAEVFDLAPSKRQGFELKFEWEEDKE